MRLIICIDDTDSLTSKGTGAIAEELIDLVKNKFSATASYVTRHQLLIHEDIEYTSHNSSMCFECEIDCDSSDEEHVKEDVTTACYQHLKQESAEGSDPGLAVGIIDNIDIDLLIEYGKSAKRKVLSKEIAYSTAKQAGVYLNEAGGTGIGVIGALAGVGLRLWGNDGTIKGKLDEYVKGNTYTAEKILENRCIDAIICEDGTEVKKDSTIFVTWKIKPTMLNGKMTLLLKKPSKGIDADFEVLDKDTLRYRGGNKIYDEGCQDFTPDVLEELVGDEDKRSCFNCRYRRWLKNQQIICMKDNILG